MTFFLTDDSIILLANLLKGRDAKLRCLSGEIRMIDRLQTIGAAAGFLFIGKTGCLRS